MSEFSGWSFALGVIVGAGQIIALEWRAARDRRRWYKHWRKLYPDETTKGARHDVT